MNVPTMTMPREEAREKLRWYRSQLHRKADAEYQAIAQGYEAMAEGRPLEVPWPRNEMKDGYALVPIVPADVRSKVTGQLSTYFTLWEVEQWADQRIRSLSDRDPLLLKHIGGELYAVVAEWDLTEIERAVMAGRARS